MTVLDNFRLDDKVVVVTGASKNIGLEISRAMAEAGATVVMNARSQELLEERADSIRSQTRSRVETFAADVGSRSDTDSMIEFVHGLFPQIDVLVNNAYGAGYEYLDTEIFDLTDEPWERSFATNVVGPFRLSRGFGKAMMAGRGGSIINVLSGSGFLPTPRNTAYGVGKAALWMLTRYMAMECAPTLRVNGLCPGIIVSDTGGPSSLPDRVEERLRSIPMGRVGHPAEVAPAAVYLASDAASYTSGTVLFVNGARPW